MQTDTRTCEQCQKPQSIHEYSYKGTVCADCRDGLGAQLEHEMKVVEQSLRQDERPSVEALRKRLEEKLLTWSGWEGDDMSPVMLRAGLHYLRELETLRAENARLRDKVDFLESEFACEQSAGEGKGE